MPILPILTDPIVITASRAPESEAQTPSSVTIIDQQRIDRLGEPLASRCCGLRLRHPFQSTAPLAR